MPLAVRTALLVVYAGAAAVVLALLVVPVSDAPDGYASATSTDGTLVIALLALTGAAVWRAWVFRDLGRGARGVVLCGVLTTAGSAGLLLTPYVREPGLGPGAPLLLAGALATALGGGLLTRLDHRPPDVEAEHVRPRVAPVPAGPPPSRRNALRVAEKAVVVAVWAGTLAAAVVVVPTLGLPLDGTVGDRVPGLFVVYLLAYGAAHAAAWMLARRSAPRR